MAKFFLLPFSKIAWRWANRVEEVEERRYCVRKVLRKLPIGNRMILFRLFSFLKLVVEHKDKTKMGSENVAICFAPSLFRKRQETAETIMNDLQDMLAVVRTFIDDFDYVFERAFEKDIANADRRQPSPSSNNSNTNPSSTTSSTPATTQSATTLSPTPNQPQTQPTKTQPPKTKIGSSKPGSVDKENFLAALNKGLMQRQQPQSGSGTPTSTPPTSHPPSQSNPPTFQLPPSGPGQPMHLVTPASNQARSPSPQPGRNPIMVVKPGSFQLPPIQPKPVVAAPTPLLSTGGDIYNNVSAVQQAAKSAPEGNDIYNNVGNVQEIIRQSSTPPIVEVVLVVFVGLKS